MGENHQTIEKWSISLGTQLQTSAVVCCQMFVIAELVMYIILFKDLSLHNEEVKNGNSLGRVHNMVVEFHFHEGYSPVQMKFNSTYPSISWEIVKASKHVIYH